MKIPLPEAFRPKAMAQTNASRMIEDAIADSLPILGRDFKVSINEPGKVRIQPTTELGELWATSMAGPIKASMAETGKQDTEGWAARVFMAVGQAVPLVGRDILPKVEVFQPDGVTTWRATANLSFPTPVGRLAFELLGDRLRGVLAGLQKDEHDGKQGTRTTGTEPGVAAGPAGYGSARAADAGYGSGA